MHQLVLFTTQFTPAPSCFLSLRSTLPVIMLVPSVFTFADNKVTPHTVSIHCVDRAVNLHTFR